MSKSIGLIAVLLFAIAGCATGETSEVTNTVKPEATGSADMLRPYLGRWSPTSFAEMMNIGAVTITAANLAFDTEGVMTFLPIREEARGLVLQVTGSEPPEAFASYPAIGLTMEWPTDEGPGPAEDRTEEFLWIYW